MKRFFAFLILFLGIFATAASAAPEEPVSFETSDHLTLQALYYPLQDAKASILLIHMLGRDKSDWKNFAQALQAKGYDALAIDLRGHGDSSQQGDAVLNWKNFSDKDFKMMIEDVDAGYQWLKHKNGGSKPIFMIGASVGANLVLIYTSQNPEVKGAVLLSPGLDYHGIQIARYTAQYKDRPLLMVAARDDEYSLVSTRYLMDIAKIDDKTLKDYPPGAGHGTQIFNFKPAEKNETALQDLLLDWIGKRLNASAPSPK